MVAADTIHPRRIMEEEFSLSLSRLPQPDLFIYMPTAYRSSDCKRRMLIITLSAYNRTPMNNLVAMY